MADELKELGEEQAVAEPEVMVTSDQVAEAAITERPTDELSQSIAAFETVQPGMNSSEVLTPQFSFYTHTGASHGQHIAPSASSYQCADCAELERRVRAAFKELGFKF